MDFEQAVELEQRIRRDCHRDVMIQRVPFTKGYLVKVRTVDRPSLIRGLPHYLESEEDWNELRGRLR